MVQGLKSIGEKDVIFHQGLHNVSLHQEALPWVDSGVTVVTLFQDDQTRENFLSYVARRPQSRFHMLPNVA